jgi:eukaryotic translation initiation factor 2C
MEPIMKYPFNVRSFFTDTEQKEIGGGMVLWRGYFQSVRPAIGKMLINVDISTGCMYKPGPFINLCMEFFSCRDTNGLVRSLTNERDRHRLQRFVANLRIKTRTRAGSSAIRVLKKITSHGADRMTFTLRETNTTLTVADYFRQAQNRQLQYPSLPCVEVRFIDTITTILTI